MTTSTFNVPAFHYNGMTVPPWMMIDIINEFEKYSRDYKFNDLDSCIYDFFNDDTKNLYNRFKSTFKDECDRWDFVDTFREYLNDTLK